MFRKIVTGLIPFFAPFLLLAADVSPELAGRTASNFLLEKSSVLLSGKISRTAEPVITPYTREGELVYYLVDFQQQGFVAVAGDDRCTPVLAWSVDPMGPGVEMPEATAAWFDWYAAQVMDVKERNLAATDAISGLWDVYGAEFFSATKDPLDIGVEPLTVSRWGQRYYYNNMCPADPDGPGGHAIAGCVATAMAQVLFYYRYPVHGEGANGYMSNYGYEYVDYEEAEYLWDEMVNAVYGPLNPEVTELIYHVGVSVEMNYGPSSSGATTEETVDALKNFFKYDEKLHYISKFDLGEAFRDSVIDNLNRQLVMIYRGGSFGAAHSFVCDGYQDSTYFHFNWGWDGSFNGYYTMENLNPNVYDFTFDQGAVINIYPREDYPGFCQGAKTLSASRGTFTDGSGPEPCPVNLNCSWLIGPENPAISNIMMWFTRFDLDDDDVVSIYDGDGINAPLLGQFTGTDLPSMIVSSGNALYVAFETGDAGEAQGWQIEYFAYSGPFCNALSEVNALSQNYITDGSGPYNYTDLSDCGWLISPQNEEYDSIASINFWFHWLDLEQGDTLYLHDGSDNTAPVIGKYYGSEVPGTVVTSGNSVYLNFIADEQITADGWAAGYSSNLPVYCQDTLVYTDKTAILEDGSANKKYTPNTNCSWLVNTENTEVITFEFLEFDLEYGYDQLKFYDATDSPPSIMATYWGNELPPMLTMPADKVLITFTSDESMEYGGWKIRYTALAPGIDETTLAAGIKLFPNPAGTTVSVQGLPDDAILGLYDLKMQRLDQKHYRHAGDRNGQLDVSGISPGMYFVSIEMNRTRIIKKLIVH